MEVDSIRIEFTHWMETSDKIISYSLIAAKFLWLCRINKLPITLNEISRDFRIRPKIILNELSETGSYIPPLSTIEYINRISVQLDIPNKIKEYALHLVGEKDIAKLDSTSPILKACCNVLRATKAFGYDLSISNAASVLGISTTGIRIAIKRLK